MQESWSHTIRAYWRTGKTWAGKPWIEWSMKVGLTGIACYYISQKLTEVQLLDTWEQMWGAGLGYLIPACLLVVVNLSCEAQKYALLVQHTYPLGWKRAMLGILAGMPLGLLTPNRIGEYVGRLWVLPAKHRWAGGAFTFINRNAQMLITLALGLIALELSHAEMRSQWGDWVGWLRGIAWLLIVMWVGVAGIGLWQVHHHRWERIWGLQKILPALRQVGTQVLAYVVAWSFLRNLIFVGQYILLLYACGYSGEIGTAFLMVWLVFLVKSLIPIASFAELGIRESVALAVMGYFGVSEAISFSSTFAIYSINILLPALVGLICLNYLKTS